MLTERQEEILDFIRKYQSANSIPPSTRDVSSHFGFSQTAAVKHLRALSDKGQLAQFADASWGLKTSQVQGHLFDIPVYGSIPAGLPAMQEQDPEETVRIDPAIFGIRKPRSGHFWFLRVTGDSMIGLNIFDGDLVALVRKDPKSGDVIAALVDETSTTLKTFIKEKGRVLLRAANKHFADIVPRQLESQGVVIGIIRRKIA